MYDFKTSLLSPISVDMQIMVVTASYIEPVCIKDLFTYLLCSTLHLVCSSKHALGLKNM